MSNYTKGDYWSEKARREGYPARSVYKLQELDEKFQLLPRPGPAQSGQAPFRVLDLGAAPGSWSLYILRKLGDRVKLVAADLLPLQAAAQGLWGEHCLFIQGDITQEETRLRIAERGPYRLVLSDAAPSTTGNRPVDTLRSLALAEAALGYAEALLEPGGGLVLKIFQGGESACLLKKIRSRFAAGRSFKPQACRKDSFETYFLGLGKR